MVDFRPLLFANALILMLIVTAGFTRFHSEPYDVALRSQPSAPVIPAPPQTDPTPALSTPAATDASAASFQPGPLESSGELPPIKPAQPLVDSHTPEIVEETAAAEPGYGRTSIMTPPDTTPAGTVPNDTPEPGTGKLVVRSNVYGDRVSINGRDYGSTRLDLELNPGEYHLIVSKAGHKTWEASVRLGAGETRSVAAELVRFDTVEYRNGQWRGDVISGNGTYKDDTGLVYEGQFRNRRFHGQGQANLPDGSRYVGDWADGEFDGRGTLRLANGDVYSGQFAHGDYSGEGTLTTASGDIYTGLWAEGRLNGPGTLTRQDGVLYVGGFRKGLFHGEGTLTYADGRYYEGGFADGEYHGRGILIFADGKKYEGQFMEGQYHGQGDLYNPNGSRITGSFKFGEPYGQAELTTPEGEIFTARTSDPGICYRENSYRATQCPPMPGW